MLKKNTLREIKNSLGRYLAILAIVALGVGFFAGLKVTREAMVTTADDYLESSSFFDYQVMNSLGFEKEDVEALSAEKDVKTAEGSVSTDVLFTTEGSADRVLKLHSMPENINTLLLETGRLPEKADECVVDYRLFDDPIGSKIKISSKNEKDTLDMLKYREYTIVGTVVSPIYLNFERGTTALGDGSVSGFAYITEDGFDTDYYTEIYLLLDQRFKIYSDEYKDLIESTEDGIQEAVDRQADRRYRDIVKDAKEELADAQKEYDDNYQKYLSEKADAEAELSASYQKLQNSQAQAAANKRNLDAQEKSLVQNRTKVQQGLAQAAQKRQEFEANKTYMTEEQIAATEAQLAQTEQQLSASLSQIEAGLAQIQQGRKDIAAAEKEIADGFAKYYDGKKTAEAEFKDAEAEFKDARRELRDAKEEIADIKAPDTYVLDRNSNIGYACFENDSRIVDGIARVFPIFFFLVAALVCMTTMTRMIDEQRTQIGVLKALGYSNGAIAGKYLFYAGSAAFIGCAIGFFTCCYIFPTVIWNAYGMMYDFSGDLYYIVNGPLALISLAVSLLCSMGATAVSCYADFREVPAQLIRPKSPKDGKRIFLERITFIWNKLGFLYKVSFRNVFRYKKRFFMMVLGISGCTALLVTGFGIRDSIKNVVNYQFDEIQVYDYSIVFDKNMTEKKQQRFMEGTEGYIDDIIFLHQSSADLVSGDKVKAVSLIASENENFDDFIHLFTKDDEKIPYPGKGEAVVCKKLADTYDLSKGNKILLRDGNMKEMELTVSAVCENYVENYVYVSPDSCKDQWGYQPEVKSALVKAAGAPNSKAADEKDQIAVENDTKYIYRSSSKTLNQSGVTTISVNNDMRERVANMMKSLDYIIALIIICAGALAFIVLYNLTNINITERIREIATIKVLGFYPGETSAYVFRENFFLTGISSLVGLLLGKALHAFVIAQIQVDLLSFDIRITGFSYVLSVVLTFVFAIVVNLVMYRKLDRISMTESLKSIE